MITFITIIMDINSVTTIGLPAKQAVIKHATVPEHKALNARLAKSPLRLGAIGLKPPIWIPIDVKLAKPHKAYAEITSERT